MLQTSSEICRCRVKRSE